MEFDFFLKTIHEKIGNKSLYEFTLDFFDSAGDDDLYVTHDMIRNWFSKRNQGYKKIFKDKEFNDIRFNTFLKARTYGTWRELQTYFNEVTQDKIETLIDFTTDNHDKFIESIEWQFRTILRVPIPVDITNDKDNQEIITIPESESIKKNELPDENTMLKKRIEELEKELKILKKIQN